MDKIIEYLRSNPNYVIALIVTFAVLIVACVLGFIIKKFNLLRFMDKWSKKKKPQADDSEKKADEQKDTDNGFGFEFDDPADLVAREREAEASASGETVESEETVASNEGDENTEPDPAQAKKSRFSEMVRNSLKDDLTDDYENEKKLTPAKQPEQKIEIVVLPEDTPIEEEEVFEGKWRILRDGNTYVAELHNDADELLIKSQNYSELSDARGAIDTLKKHIKGNNFSVVVNRNGKFQFKLFSTANRLICNGEPYDTRNACLEKIEEVKKIAFTAEIVRG